MRSFAHISDLHVGRKPEKALRALSRSLLNRQLDRVIVTGDITEKGMRQQFGLFHSIFAQVTPKLILVPGNHDRLGNDVGVDLMTDRVIVVEDESTYVVLVDSTGPHNKWLFMAHGIVCHRVLKKIDQALEAAPIGKLVVIALHHHPTPLPEEGYWEKLSRWFGWPFAGELHLGADLIDLARGRSDLILHGHRHTPAELVLPGERELRIYNAGCTPSLGRYRVFRYREGKLLNEPDWNRF